MSSLFLFALSLHGSKLENADGLMLDEAYIMNFWFRYSLFFPHNRSILLHVINPDPGVHLQTEYFPVLFCITAIQRPALLPSLSAHLVKVA